MNCHYCKQNPGVKRHSDVVWNGFKDGDTGHHVCFGCRETHYKEKSKTMQGLYSELPVIIAPPQLQIHFK